MVGSVDTDEIESVVAVPSEMAARDSIQAAAAADPYLRNETKDELRVWSNMAPDACAKALREVIGQTRTVTPEVLVHLCCAAHVTGNKKQLNLAFEALVTIVSPRLLAQARFWQKQDRKDRVQDVLVHTFNAIRAGKARLAGNNFALFSKRRLISLYRQEKTKFEGYNRKIEATAEIDPVDQLADRAPSAEERALLQRALTKLSPKQREVFVQVHLLKMARPEVAAHHHVDVRTIYDWLKEAEEIVGLTGANDAD